MLNKENNFLSHHEWHIAGCWAKWTVTHVKYIATHQLASQEHFFIKKSTELHKVFKKRILLSEHDHPALLVITLCCNNVLNFLKRN
jgi:hypothetical protein